MLVHHIEHNQVLQEQAVLMTVITERVPRIPASERIEILKLGQGFYRVNLRYGFMQTPNVPVALRECEQYGLRASAGATTYYILIPTRKGRGMALWREKLFSFMSHNALGATAFFGIPPGQVVEIGIQVEI